MKLISNGGWITCPNGHRQLQALRDIHSGELIESAAFVTEDGIHPESNTAIKPCQVCGEKYIKRMGLSSFRFHSELSGWPT